ncbi:MAG: hypothetical protein ACI32F_05190 [Allobaculum sp.]
MAFLFLWLKKNSDSACSENEDKKFFLENKSKKMMKIPKKFTFFSENKPVLG